MRARALLLDDSDVNLAVYRGALSAIEHIDAEYVVSPHAALASLRAQASDVVVVDYHMPEMDGLEFIRRAKEIVPNALLVMITAETDTEVRHRALEAGAADFLNKPIDRIEFQARMRNLAALATSRAQLADRAMWLRSEVDRATSALREREIETIVRLTRAAEFRDSVTGMHVIRVGEMCAALARTIGLPEEECQMLLLAAPMHDIGKVATPDHILLKPGKLTPEEFEIMKQHTIAGHSILKGSASPMLQKAAEIALTHHERWDGTGYPYGLRGTDIPLSGRLCSTVDVFDALTSVRPYKQAWSVSEAVAELDKMSGAHFDPDIVALFHDSLDAIEDIRLRFSDAHAA